MGAATLALRFIVFLLILCLVFLACGALPGGYAWLARALLVAAAALLACRWVLSPWRDLERAVERLLRGDYGARLDDVSEGALARPAAAFNTMAEHLAAARESSRDKEERVEAVLGASDRACILVDSDGAATLASPSTARLFPRFNPASALGSLSIPGLIPMAADAQGKGVLVTGLLEEGERGMGRTFAARVSPLAKGGLVVYLGDVTQEQRLERVKADLVANVSHELRTPLAAMAGLADTLGDPDLDPGRRGHFQERLEAQIRRMQALVDDLLSLSQLESGHNSIHRQEVSIKDLCEEVARLLAPQAEKSSVALSVTCPQDLRLETDRLLLDVVVRNLAENAVRYNRPGGAVEIAAAPGGGGQGLTIRVRDTGEGIPATHLPRIFERFYRVDPHRSRERGGTGLGLAIVKHAAENLGGSVSVESTVGEGSTFTLTLPGEGPHP